MQLAGAARIVADAVVDYVVEVCAAAELSFAPVDENELLLSTPLPSAASRKLDELVALHPRLASLRTELMPPLVRHYAAYLRHREGWLPHRENREDKSPISVTQRSF